MLVQPERRRVLDRGEEHGPLGAEPGHRGPAVRERLGHGPGGAGARVIASWIGWISRIPA
nr:hypothetical protein GCM10025732_44200 [Glycomyces mayteni]